MKQGRVVGEVEVLITRAQGNLFGPSGALGCDHCELFWLAAAALSFQNCAHCQKFVSLSLDRSPVFEAPCAIGFCAIHMGNIEQRLLLSVGVANTAAQISGIVLELGEISLGIPQLVSSFLGHRRRGRNTSHDFYLFKGNSWPSSHGCPAGSHAQLFGSGDGEEGGVVGAAHFALFV